MELELVFEFEFRKLELELTCSWLLTGVNKDTQTKHIATSFAAVWDRRLAASVDAGGRKPR